MNLPYENATSGKAAVSEIEKILRGFGATSFGVMENYGSGDLLVQFEWRSRQVSLRANAQGYAAAWLREHPHTDRHKATRGEHEARALRIGRIAVYSILRDWIKGQVVAVEVGMMPFEAAFLSALVLPDGHTVFEAVTAQGMVPRIEDKRAAG